MDTHDTEPVIEIVNLTKRFGRTEALRGINLSVGAGELVALLGPNGAGKSTLIKILDGVYQPDSGSISSRLGERSIGVVHQDLGLVPTMTVAENLFLGFRGRLRHPRAEADATAAALRRVGLQDVSPHALVSALSLGQQAMVAVARTLHRGAQVVVVDEVTAGLHPHEVRWLVDQLRHAASNGATVVMVTHKLREVIDVATRFVVIVDGLVSLDKPAGQVSYDHLVEVLSSGRSLSTEAGTPASSTSDSGEVRCTLTGVWAGAAGPIDLTVRAGMVTALTGPLGSGLHEIAYVVAGLLKPTRGTVDVARGIRRTCVPAHRETEGVFAEETVAFNLTAGAWRHWLGPGGFLRVRRQRRDAQAMAELLSVKTPSLDTKVSTLSGGNQQKTLLGRALVDPPDLLVLCEPTRGVDVATRREIYAQVRRVAAEGTAVLVASTDFEDIAALADRTGVLDNAGTIMRWVERNDLKQLLAEFV